MNFSQRILTEKTYNSKLNAKETILKLIEGTITDVTVFFPKGHKGLTYCQILDGEVQIFPTNLGESYSGEGEKFKTAYYISKPWELKIKTWNLDETYDHAIIVRVTLRTKEILSKQIIMRKRDEGFLGAIIKFLNEVFS